MEKIFNIQYNNKLDRLQIKDNKKTNKFFEFINNHKFISIILTSFLLFSVINFYLIFNFVKILENVIIINP